MSKPNTVEIERRFDMTRFPDLPVMRQSSVWQKYLSVDPEVRIRKKILSNGAIKCFLTIKGDGLMKRTEVEVPITIDQYDALDQMDPDHPAITKDFREYQLADGLVLEVSLVDKGLPSEFMYAEIEFPNEEAANAFEPPAYLGEDHTNNPGRKMKYVWKETRLAQN